MSTHIKDSITTKPDLVPFSLDKQIYDQTTLTGRFMHFQRVVDPRNFFLTRAQLQASIKLVNDTKQRQTQLNGQPMMVTKKEAQELTRASYIVNSSTVRDTGDEIPRFMRMCAFLPVNIPILFGMLLSKPTIMNTIFWQWFNQSFNAGINYGNRNASSPYTNKDLAFGYSAAVGSSVSVALLLRKLFSGLSGRVTGSKLILVNSLVAALASGSANFLNTFCMRQAEAKNGIEVFSDEQMTQRLGVSKDAANRAIIETATSRIFLSFACLCSPAIIFYGFECMKLTPKTPKMKMAYETGVFIFSLMFALPASISLFPQTGALPASMVEAELRKDGVTHVYYNKGL